METAGTNDPAATEDAASEVIWARLGKRGENQRERVHHEDPQFTVQQILDWADTWHAAHGEWPTARSGEIPNTTGMTWRGVNFAIRQGRGGLPVGSTLARLLVRQRAMGHERDLPFDIPTILRWADAHHARHGIWPKTSSGPIPECPQETWQSVNRALYKGLRGLTGGSSLPRLLSADRAVPIRQRGSSLTERQVLDWADLHQARTGSWPTNWSGPIPEAVGDRWQSIDSALRTGARGLTGGSSVARLLAERRNVRNRKGPPALSVARILRWADAYHSRTSEWPKSTSGPVAESPADTWRAISAALRNGTRGLRGGSSLARLLQKRRGVGNHKKVR